MLTRTLRVLCDSEEIATEAFTQPVRVRARLLLGEVELVSFSGIASEERDLGPELVGFLDAVRAEVKAVLDWMAEETDQDDEGDPSIGK